MASSYTLTNAQARRFLLLKHGLVGEHTFCGKDGALAYVRQSGCIQFDPVDICGRNAELVLQARVRGFTKQMLYDLLYVDRKLIDYFDKNLAILPVEDWPCLARTRQEHRDHGRARDEINAVADDIKAQLRARGAACAADIDMEGSLIWYWGGRTKLARAALETLYFRGDLVIHHKRGALKYYALAEEHIPAEILQAPDPHVSAEAYSHWHIARRIASVGLLWNRPSMAWLGSAGMNSPKRRAAFPELLAAGDILAVDVEGIKDTLYCAAGDRALLEAAMASPPLEPRTELLAPLDNLLWDRRLVEALFGFTYKWEVYTPVEQRQYGHYVLPILSGERFIGRAEIVNERKSRMLVVRNVWLEDGVERTEALKRDLADCLARFARFNECAQIRRDDAQAAPSDPERKGLDHVAPPGEEAKVLGSVISAKEHYDRLIDDGNDPVHDPPQAREHMDKWDGAAFLELLHLASHKSVLEIGIGTGRLALRVLRAGCRRLVGCDLSARTLARARENLADYANVELLCGDFLDLDFGATFDVIYSSLTFLHIRDKARAIHKVSTLLNDQGRFVVSLAKDRSETLAYGDHRVTVYPDDRDAIPALLSSAGLHIDRVTETEFAHIVASVKRTVV